MLPPLEARQNEARAKSFEQLIITLKKNTEDQPHRQQEFQQQIDAYQVEIHALRGTKDPDDTAFSTFV